MVLNTIREADLKGKRVLIRVDFNVPLKDGAVTDNTRIKAALPTIKYILDNGASLVVMTHLGRPKGEKNEKYSLAPVAAEFSKLLGKDVKLASDVIGDEVKKEVEEGIEVVAAKMPAVVTFTKPAWDPRYPTIKRKMAANRAEIPVLGEDAFPDIDTTRIGLKGSPTHVKKTFVPQKKSGGVKIKEETAEDSAKKLFQMLSDASMI